MNVAVCVPWIDVGCEHRARALEFIQDWWTKLGIPVVYGTADGEHVNRAAARNDAARRTDADILVFADADTFIEAEQFAAMVDRAQETDCLVHGYTKHWLLTRSATSRAYYGELVRGGTVLQNQPSGVIAVSRSLLNLVGGHDERFLGWGGEDRAFQLACNTMSGPGWRIQGDSFHLWHPPAREKGRAYAMRRANMALGMRYKRLAGIVPPAGPLRATKDARFDSEGMRALLAEPGGPLHVEANRAIH